jgi:hypothetical protein
MKNIATFTTIATGLVTPWDVYGEENDDSGSDDTWWIESTVNNGYPYLSSFPWGFHTDEELVTMPVYSSGSFTDDFADDTLDASYTVVNMSNKTGNFVSETGGQLECSARDSYISTSNCTFVGIKKSVTGNFVAEVYLASIVGSTNTNAAAGLLVRNVGETMSPGLVAMVASPTYLKSLIDVDANNLPEREELEENTFSGAYFKITKTGTVFTTAYSLDNIEWTQLDSVDVPDALETQDVCLASASHDYSNVQTAIFDNFSITQ